MMVFMKLKSSLVISNNIYNEHLEPQMEVPLWLCGYQNNIFLSRKCDVEKNCNIISGAYVTLKWDGCGF